MKVQVIDKENSGYYSWGENCDSWILVDTMGLSVKQESMPAGAKEKMHFHELAQQFFYILSGTATFYLEEDIIRVAEKRGILIEPNKKHLIANEADEALDFLVISQPTTNNDRKVL